MTGWADHLIVAPVVLPLAVTAVMLLLDEERRRTKVVLSVGAALANLVVAMLLLHAASTAGGSGARAYAVGDWPAPFGIVLVADRLSAMMLAVTGVLGLGALLYALARWHRAGPRFHAFFLLLLMGVNGAFLTGDLFNLFVFFEVLLAASYGLALHGSGEARVRAGLHYIAVNLTASMFFLVGVSLIYGVTGTLNMADLAGRVAGLSAADRPLFEIGCAVLAVTFLTKAAAWPLGFWLPTTYAAVSPPVAAVFAVLSKVGVYAVVRLFTLLFGPHAGPSAGFGADWLLVGGLISIAWGTVGVVAGRDLSRTAGYCIIISTGTVLAVLGSGDAAALGGALFYMTGSILAAGALFMLAEILTRDRPGAAAAPAEQVFTDEFHDPFELDDDEEEGLVIPAAVALTAGGFLLCALTLAGLPPMAGFIGKLAIFTGLVGQDPTVSAASWFLIAVLTLSGLGVLIGLARSGVALLWVPANDAAPSARAVEVAAIGGLLAATLALTLWGGAGLRYTERTAAWLLAPSGYVNGVLGSARP